MPRRAEGVAKQIAADGGTAISVPVDVSDPESAKAMADRTLAEFGGIDYLVNNAAIFGGMKLDFLLTVDPEYYKKFMSVNLDGALWCTRAVYKKMAKRGGGAIVNQSSTAAWLYSNFYGLAKVGINGLTQQLSRELGGQNIRINAIAPGPIDTEANRTTTPKEIVDDIVKGLPLSRMGTPEDLVGMCLFLLSRPGLLDHRADLQCRRRADHPIMSDQREARIYRTGQHGRADGQADGRMARRADGLRHPDRGHDAVGRGAAPASADSVADVAAADIISVTVLNDAQVREVVGELASHAKPGTVIAIHSTISDTTAVELARELKPQGIHIVDAPVSGGGRAAERSSSPPWWAPSDEVFERIKEPFSHWASLVVHAGEPGAGTRMKLARNMLTFISYAAVVRGRGSWPRQPG